MRTSLFISAIALFCNLIMGCAPKVSEQLMSTSSDGSLVIEVSGTQEEIAEPWILSIVAKKAGRTIGPLYAPLWASEPNEDNVKFNWKSNTTCRISIHNRDGEVQEIPVQIN